jgi:hypothetical protein
MTVHAALVTNNSSQSCHGPPGATSLLSLTSDRKHHLWSSLIRNIPHQIQHVQSSASLRCFSSVSYQSLISSSTYILQHQLSKERNMTAQSLFVCAAPSPRRAMRKVGYSRRRDIITVVATTRTSQHTVLILQRFMSPLGKQHVKLAINSLRSEETKRIAHQCFVASEARRGKTIEHQISTLQRSTSCNLVVNSHSDLRADFIGDVIRPYSGNKSLACCGF